MPQNNESYKTLAKNGGPFELRDRKSKFLGYAFPVSDREAAEARIAALWETHQDASHVCYAFRIGRVQPEIRAQDDGEPTHAAGAPILAQIQGYELFDVLVAVVRYYGGTKLGVGGLIQAYRETAAGAVEMAGVVERIPMLRASLAFGYGVLDPTLRAIEKYRLEVVERHMALDCRLVIRFPFSEEDHVRNIFKAIPGVSWEIL